MQHTVGNTSWLQEIMVLVYMRVHACLGMRDAPVRVHAGMDVEFGLAVLFYKDNGGKAGSTAKPASTARARTPTLC